MNIIHKIGLAILIVIVAAIAVGFFFGPAKSDVAPLFSHDESVRYDNVPAFLQRSFPNTDFANADPAIAKVLSGGPPKDGIPAIDEPRFVSVTEFERPDEVQAIVISAEDTTKVYPYNILTWHEIVNDTVAGTPVAVTFCPLCGSAIVYERQLPVGTTTFGVSGALIESNMVMYDRATETLWQQSTGEALAGELMGTRLELYPFQLLTMGEVRSKYPEALVLSEDTGHLRNYGRNPYSGYTENERFVFAPSSFDERFPSKSIMAVFRVDDMVAATPWESFTDSTTREATLGDTKLTLNKTDGELEITDAAGNEYPFFFEMWFSFAVQNPNGIVVE